MSARLFQVCRLHEINQQLLSYLCRLTGKFFNGCIKNPWLLRTPAAFFPLAHAVDTDWIILYPGCLTWLEAVHKKCQYAQISLFSTSYLTLCTSGLIPAPNVVCCSVKSHVLQFFSKPPNFIKAKHCIISHHDIPFPKTVGSMKYINISLLLFFYTACYHILTEYSGLLIKK